MILYLSNEIYFLLYILFWDKEYVVCEYIYIHTYNGILFSHKNEWNSAICNNMDLESILLNEVSQKGETNTIWYHLYVESKIWHKWIYL